MTASDRTLGASNRRRRRYPSDLSNHEWALLKPLLARSPGPGRPRTVDLRAIINAIFYINRTGAQWRMLPKGFPCWSHAYYYFRAWSRDGTWREVNDALREKVRVGAGKLAEPSAATSTPRASRRPKPAARAASTRISRSRDGNATSSSIRWACC